MRDVMANNSKRRQGGRALTYKLPEVLEPVPPGHKTRNSQSVKRTYHRSGSSERSGVGDQACQGVLLPRSVDYVGIVCHHDRHLLHHFDSGGRMEERMKTKDEEEEEW